jgi:hypothetical protein
VNVGSHAHYIATGGEAHYPLIEAIAPDQVGEVDLVPYDSSLLKINLNMCLLFRGGATGWVEAHPEIWQKNLSTSGFQPNPAGLQSNGAYGSMERYYDHKALRHRHP